MANMVNKQLLWICIWIVGGWYLWSCVDNEPLEERLDLNNELDWISGGEFVVLLNPQYFSEEDDKLHTYMLLIRDQNIWPQIRINKDFNYRPSKIFFLEDSLITLNEEGEMGRNRENLISWDVAKPLSAELYSVAYGEGVKIVVGVDGTILKNTSKDNFNNWILVNSGITIQLNTIVYGRGRFIAAGDSSTIYLSDSQGDTWRPIDVSNVIRSNVFPSRFSIQDSIYQNNTFFLVGFGGLIIISKDGGESWQQPKLHEYIEDVNFYGITYGRSKLIVVGGGRLRNGEVVNTNRHTSLSENRTDVRPAIVLISENLGRTWLEQQTHTLPYNGIMLDVSYRIANETIRDSKRYGINKDLIITVGTRGGIFYSLDGSEWRLMGLDNLVQNISSGGDSYSPYKNARPVTLRRDNTQYKDFENRVDFLSVDVYR